MPAASTYIAVAIAETFHAFLWTMGIHGDLTIADTTLVYDPDTDAW